MYYTRKIEFIKHTNQIMEPFKNFIKIGIQFPKKNVKLPKNWNTLTQSIYNNEPNFAILTGEINNIIVLDLDKKDDNFIALKWIENNLNTLQHLNTLITKTINHGYHIFFKYTHSLKNHINCGNLHIDILSNNKCCYQGTGYDVIHHNEIRELTQHEITTLTQLIKDKKIKAEKPLPAIEADEVPFELPEGWSGLRAEQVPVKDYIFLAQLWSAKGE